MSHSLAVETFLQDLSCEKIATDKDRIVTQVQPYQIAYTSPINTRIITGGKDGDPLSLPVYVAAFGALYKRYVREDEITVVAVGSGDQHLAIPLHTCLGGKVSLQDLSRKVDSLISHSVAISDATVKDQASAGSIIPGGLLLPGQTIVDRAYRYRGKDSPDFARQWPHICVYDGKGDFPNLAAVKADLCMFLEVTEVEGGSNSVRSRLAYNSHLFGEVTTEAMVRCLHTLLSNCGAAVDSGTSVHEVNCVADSDITRMFAGFNQTTIEFPFTQCIHQFFERSADMFPQNVAVTGPTVTPGNAMVELTYAKVEEQANRLSRYLTDTKGVQHGDRVGILIDRSIDFYISMLAVLKAGAAYVSIDPEYPDDRIQYMLEDSSSKVLVTTQVYKKRVSSSLSIEYVILDDSSDQNAIKKCLALRPDSLVETESLCYIIYTSGSTGKPKGVLLSHCNVVNLVRAEGIIYQVKPTDKVLQGFSTSFDASVEEIWMAFYNGATLVTGTKEIMRSGPDFPKILEELGVTVLSTVPTLLSTVDDDFKNIRIIITGGEACSRDLVNRWAKPNVRFFNTYGPTEATVIATYKECSRSDGRVTIGKPLPNYQCYILDEFMLPVPPGGCGELIIGGISVSIYGYNNLPEKTKSVFVDDFIKTDHKCKLYRTGDLVRYDARGEIEYYGRIDTQVKIRGYRIELAEIESVITELPDILSAVVNVETAAGVKHLVAFVVPANDKLDTVSIMDIMKTKLAKFMIPTAIVKIDSIPTLPSGKCDRKKLPKVLGNMGGASEKSKGDNTSVIQAMAPIEATIAKIWDQVLSSPTIVSVNDNFFDLGGHSLLVSKCVSALRKIYPSVASKDIYSFPTIQSLAKHIQSCIDKSGDSTEEKREYHTPSPLNSLGSDVFQFVMLYVIGAYSALMQYSYIWLLAYSVVIKKSPLEFFPYVLLTSMLLWLVGLVFSVIIKWIVIGKLKEGKFKLWGTYHLRLWFANAFIGQTISFWGSMLSGTVMYNWYLRMLGCKIGKNVIIRGFLDGMDLVDIEDGVTINTEAMVKCIKVQDGYITITKVVLKKRCTVGIRTFVCGGATLGEDSKVGSMSLVPSGVKIPPNERWAGSPAQKVGNGNNTQLSRPGPGFCVSLLQILWILAWRSIIIFTALPFLALLRDESLNMFLGKYDVKSWADIKNVGHSLYELAIVFFCLSISYSIFMSLFLAIMKRVLFSGMTDLNIYPLNSIYYFKRWAIDMMLNSMYPLTRALRGTVYLPYWFRLMGTKVGSMAEISSYANVCPEKLTVGDGSFIADSVVIGQAYIDQGIVIHEQVTMGQKCFVGNGSVVTGGTDISDSMLVALQSLAPKRGEPGSTYLGSLPFKMDAREGNTNSVDVALTFQPSRLRVSLRYVVEFLGYILLTFYGALYGAVLFVTLNMCYIYMTKVEFALIGPLILMFVGVLACLLTILTKWVVIGRFKEGVYPLYGSYVWRTELVERIEESFAEAVFVKSLSGTIFMGVWYRCMGVKVGKRVYFDNPIITEHDLVTIGDNCSLEASSTIQAHLFQDRLRTCGKINIGNQVSIGKSSVVLLNAKVGEKTAIESLSLILRNEELPPYTRWLGLPAQIYKPADTKGKTPADIKLEKSDVKIDIVVTGEASPQAEDGLLKGQVQVEILL